MKTFTKPDYYTSSEGDKWHPWPSELSIGVNFFNRVYKADPIIDGRSIHSLVWGDLEDRPEWQLHWDRVNGFTRYIRTVDRDRTPTSDILPHDPCESPACDQAICVLHQRLIVNERLTKQIHDLLAHYRLWR